MEVEVMMSIRYLGKTNRRGGGLETPFLFALLCLDISLTGACTRQMLTLVPLGFARSVTS